MQIMLSAGELSGDVHGANLAREIIKLNPSVKLVGFGGNRMQEAGVNLVKNFKDFNVMGVLDVLKNLRRIFQLLDELTEFMRKNKPDLLVLIDYPDFNWRLAKRAKKLGIKVFSYIPPSAWAWRKGRAADCAKIADNFVAIFPFELQPYIDAGANIEFLGNPLVDSVKPSMLQSEARAHFNVSGSDKIVLLMPGSRKQEIDLLLKPMLEAVKIVGDKFRYFLPLADSVDGEKIIRMINDTGVDVQIVHKNRYDLMSIADAAIATSGTVVLEAALLNLPCVVLYKMAALNYCIARLFVNIDYFCLPNILVNENILPELLQDEVKPQIIADKLQMLIKNHESVVADLKRACSLLGKPGASARVAKRIIECAE